MQFKAVIFAFVSGGSAAVANTAPVSEAPTAMPIVAAGSQSSLVFYNTTVTLEEVVTAYTTVCDPGIVTLGANTWTLQSTSTITVTDCPCTISRVVPTLTSSVCPSPPPAVVDVAVDNEAENDVPEVVPTPAGTGGVPFSPPSLSPTFAASSGARSVAVSGLAVTVAAAIAGFAL